MGKEVECAVFCKEIGGAPASLARNSGAAEKRVESMGSDLTFDISKQGLSIKKLVRSKGEELIASSQALAYIKQPEKIK